MRPKHIRLGYILIVITLLILFAIMAVNSRIITHNSGTELSNRTINNIQHQCFVLWDATYCCRIEPDYRIINASYEMYVTQCVRFSKVT